MSEELFAQRLKEVRLQQQMTQKQVAVLVGVTPATLSAYEKGNKKPTVDTLKKIAQTFKVTTDWLLGISGYTSAQEIKTYSDVVSLLLFVDSIFNKKSVSFFKTDVSDGDKENRYVLFLNDKTVQSFFKEWGKIRDLYMEKVIDENLYQAWVEKKLRDLKDKRIVSDLSYEELPF